MTQRQPRHTEHALQNRVDRWEIDARMIPQIAKAVSWTIHR